MNDTETAAFESEMRRDSDRPRRPSKTEREIRGEMWIRTGDARWLNRSLTVVRDLPAGD